MNIRALVQRPDRILGPPPGLKELNLVCWGLFVTFLVVPVCVVFWLQVETGSGSIRKLHSDFVYFYGVGRLVNEHSLSRLYDYALQLKIFNEIYPLRDFTYGPSPYPPFVALFFSLFARVPYEPAYLIWGAISLALYMAGITAATNEVFPREPLKLSLILCFSLAFYPFFFDTLINGQLAAVAVCSVGLAISQERHSKPFTSGLALSILAYKPTLLLPLLLMLLLTRRFKTLFGFMTGALTLTVAATAFAGIEIWQMYARFLSYFGHAAGLSGHSALLSWQFVDLNSLSREVPGGQSRSGLGILISVTAAIATWLAVLLWKSATGGRPVQHLAWAVTLTWTLLLNVYVPVYDSVLVIIAVVLTLGALKDLEWGGAAGWVTFLSLLIFAASCITETLARRHGIQLLSILLAVFGLVQISLLRQAIGQELPHEKSEPLAE